MGLPHNNLPLSPRQHRTGPAIGFSQRIWSNEIPPRNPVFTGRGAELGLLRSNLNTVHRRQPFIQVVSGLGGIGKTEIAIEYVHRHRDKYELIWWIRAEHHDRVRDALVNLAQRLELRSVDAGSGRDRTIAAVLKALESGTHPNWLLVYDNATQPRDLQRYLPACLPGGHIIITSSPQDWPGYIRTDNIEVLPFTEEESVSFLRRRVPDLAVDRNLRRHADEEREAEAARLAAALGHLPIAMEHAAAYLNETHENVDSYLSRFSAMEGGIPGDPTPGTLGVCGVRRCY
jgi:hypothetical protein